ncbi:MAG: hypothetical protein HYT47_00325 [Candidatus Vogelbacteria bacterium]|nr:hypothetical protein [Candidatus Vogelbacteria bacterium]
MSSFLRQLAELRGSDNKWTVAVNDQRMLVLNGLFDPITAVANEAGFLIHFSDWRSAAHELGLSKADADRIKDASRDITPLVSHLKRTRIKILRALGLRLEDFHTINSPFLPE